MNRELVVKLVEDFEAEVNNGGFDQFFFNSRGDFSIESLEALELIKANKTAAIAPDITLDTRLILLNITHHFRCSK